MEIHFSCEASDNDVKNAMNSAEGITWENTGWYDSAIIAFAVAGMSPAEAIE